MYWHGDIGRKKTGGNIISRRGKRKVELGSVQIDTKIGKDKRKIVKRRGGNIKVRVFSTEFVNLTDPKTKITKKTKIIDVIENKANQHYIRRKIITKGAIIETELGNSRVTSRPNQSGIINAIKI